MILNIQTLMLTGQSNAKATIINIRKNARDDDVN